MIWHLENDDLDGDIKTQLYTGLAKTRHIQSGNVGICANPAFRPSEQHTDVGNCVDGAPILGGRKLTSPMKAPAMRLHVSKPDMYSRAGGDVNQHHPLRHTVSGALEHLPRS